MHIYYVGIGDYYSRPFNEYLMPYLYINKKKLLLSRRIGRVVDCGSLENCCTARYRRFESYILRQNIKKLAERLAFLLLARW